MVDERPDDRDAPEEPVGPCRSCGAPTSSAQRYCLECGALVGSRRLEPLDMLHAREAPAPITAPPTPRAVPLAAAAAAILVAGVSGALVTGGGDGARAAIVARAPAAATAPAPVADPPATTTPSTDAAPDTSSGDGAADATADATADETASTDVADTAPADVADTSAPADPADDGGDAAADPEDATITPHVWMLALEGPRTQEAIDRIAEKGVRLTGLTAAGPDTISNATTLITGALPAAPAGTAAPTTTTAAADPAAPAATPSLPEELTTAKQTWRSYVDVQPSETPALAGACADPPAGDAAAAVLAGRTPFGRLPALRVEDACTKATFSLETLTNDVSSGEIPALSYATLGGCAAPERTVVALPDQVDDTVTAITESTEFQENGVLIVTAVGAADPCPAPGAAAPPPATTAPGATPAPNPTVVLRANAKPGSTLDVAADLRALTRLAATTLGVDPPGTPGADDVPALELPKADG